VYGTYNPILAVFSVGLVAGAVALLTLGRYPNFSPAIGAGEGS